MAGLATHAVVLAAGVGSRMRRPAATGLSPDQAAAAAQGIKGMIPDDRGRPFLDHVLSGLADAGVREVCLVIGPAHGAVREHYAQQPPRRVRVAFTVQTDPRGTADALLTTEQWSAGADFLVMNSDNLYPVDAITALVRLGEPGLVAFERAALLRESNIDAARIAAFAILRLSPTDTLETIIEKPDPSAMRGADSTSWISMNLWRFDRRIFGPCREVAPSPRGELELPLAVQLAIDEGTSLRAIRVRGGVLDLSSRDDIPRVANLLGEREIEP